LRIKNAQSASPCSLITPPLGGVISEQRCKTGQTSIGGLPFNSFIGNGCP